MSGVFYREFISRLDEYPFAVLYSDLPSRPNVPVNVLVGLEYLKAGFGWSDKEMYEAFLYNLQVPFALGYHEFVKPEFHVKINLLSFSPKLGEIFDGALLSLALFCHSAYIFAINFSKTIILKRFHHPDYIEKLSGIF